MSLTLAAVDIGASLQKGLDSFFAFLPKLIGFLIVLAIGYIVAKVVKKLVVTAAREGRPRQGHALRFSRRVRQQGGA